MILIVIILLILHPLIPRTYYNEARFTSQKSTYSITIDRYYYQYGRVILIEDTGDSKRVYNVPKSQLTLIRS